jgi:hypothetical protein
MPPPALVPWDPPVKSSCLHVTLKFAIELTGGEAKHRLNSVVVRDDDREAVTCYAGGVLQGHQVSPYSVSAECISNEIEYNTTPIPIGACQPTDRRKATVKEPTMVTARMRSVN